MQYIDMPHQFLYHLSNCSYTTYQINRSKEEYPCQSAVTFAPYLLA